MKTLKEMSIKTSVLSNADPRIRSSASAAVSLHIDPSAVRTLDALGILRLLTYPPTLSWEVEQSKPDPEIFRVACRACEVEPGDGVIMLGDELKAYVDISSTR